MKNFIFILLFTLILTTSTEVLARSGGKRSSMYEQWRGNAVAGEHAPQRMHLRRQYQYNEECMKDDKECLRYQEKERERKSGRR